jgi:hypothetical protein
VLDEAQPFRRHDPRAAALPSPGARRGETFVDPLSDPIALHFREGGLDLQERAPRWRGLVHGRIERLERDAYLFEVFDHPDFRPRSRRSRALTMRRLRAR